MQTICRQAFLTLCLSALMFFNLSAQSSPASPGVRIVAINSLLFGESAGVTRLINTQNIAEAEFKHKGEEIKQLQDKSEALSRDLKNPAASNFQSKYEEIEKLNRDIKVKGEQYQAQFQKRYNELLKPVYAQMETALKQWTKQKGYDMVVDISKDEKGMFVWFEESLVKQSTTDLIKYINSVMK